MNDAWQLLGLDSASATLADVKKAYARLLRLHRPDQDPEGFRKVRSAYESALAYLHWRQESQEFDEAAEASPSLMAGASLTESIAESPSDRAPPLLPPQAREAPTRQADLFRPAGFDEAKSALTSALAGGDGAGQERALQQITHICQESRAGMIAWGEFLVDVFHDKPTALARIMVPDYLKAELDQGDIRVTNQMVACWEDAGDIGRLMRLAYLMAQSGQRPEGPAVAVAMARVAGSIAYFNHELATTLANLAYPQLPVESRENAMSHIERQIGIGLIFSSFNQEQRNFWFGRIYFPANPWAWTGPDIEKALKYLNTLPLQWQGYRVIQSVCPPEFWFRVQAQLFRKEKALRRKNLFSGKNVGGILAIIFLVVGLLGGNKSTKQSANYDASVQAYERLHAEALKRYEARNANVKLKLTHEQWLQENIKRVAFLTEKRPTLAATAGMIRSNPDQADRWIENLDGAVPSSEAHIALLEILATDLSFDSVVYAKLKDYLRRKYLDSSDLHRTWLRVHATDSEASIEAAVRTARRVFED